MKGKVNEMKSWWNENLMKWQVDEIKSCQNCKLMNWQAGEMPIFLSGLGS